jgi:hypothetical protein
MACVEKGKSVPQIDECKKCEFQDRHVKEGIESEVRTSATAADVVIVIQQSECLTAGVQDIAFNNLKEQAKDQGITDIRVGLVGYGNKDVDGGHPNVFSRNGGVWFSDGPLPGVDLKGETNKGTLEALLMATAFDFRPEANKAIVLFSCLPCQRTLEDLLLGRYYEIEKQLLARGITLHTLSAQSIQARGTKKAAKQVIGVDSKAAYKMNSLKGGEFQVDEALREEVSLDPDYCTQLSQSTHGSVFSLPKLRESEDKAKNFRQVFARRVVASLAGPASGLCQKCSCRTNAWGRPTMACKLCDARVADLGYRSKDQA